MSDTTAVATRPQTLLSLKHYPADDSVSVSTEWVTLGGPGQMLSLDRTDMERVYGELGPFLAELGEGFALTSIRSGASKVELTFSLNGTEVVLPLSSSAFMQLQNCIAEYGPTNK